MAHAPENYYFMPAHEAPFGVAEHITNIAHNDCLPPGSLEYWYEIHEELTPHHFLVASREHIPVGFATLEVHTDGTTAILANLSVLHHARRRGIGTALIDARIETAKELKIPELYIPKLAITNTLASYYDSLGFVEQPDESRILHLG